MSNIYYNNNKGGKRGRGLYNNVGQKIKNFSGFILGVGVLASIGVGVYYLLNIINMFTGSDIKALFAEGLPEEVLRSLILVLVVPIGGTIASWLLSLLLYGYGEFIEKNT